MYGKSCWRARPCSPATISIQISFFFEIQTVIKSLSLMLGTSNFAILVFSICSFHRFLGKLWSRDPSCKGPIKAVVIDKFPNGFLLVTRKSSFTPSLSDAFFSQRILLDEENQELYFPTPPQLSSLTSMHFFRKQKQTIIINSV